MFDPDLIAGLGSHDKHQIATGLQMILETGIVENQRRASFARLYAGSATEEPEALAEKIIKARAVNLALDSIVELSEQLKENIHESPDVEPVGHKL